MELQQLNLDQVRFLDPVVEDCFLKQLVLNHHLAETVNSHLYMAALAILFAALQVTYVAAGMNSDPELVLTAAVTADIGAAAGGRVCTVAAELAGTDMIAAVVAVAAVAEDRLPPVAATVFAAAEYAPAVAVLLVAAAAAVRTHAVEEAVSAAVIAFVAAEIVAVHQFVAVGSAVADTTVVADTAGAEAVADEEVSVVSAEEFAYAAAVTDFASVAAAAEEAASVVVVAVNLMVVAIEVAAADGCSNNIATSDCMIDYSAHCHVH